MFAEAWYYVKTNFCEGPLWLKLVCLSIPMNFGLGVIGQLFGLF